MSPIIPPEHSRIFPKKIEAVFTGVLGIAACVMFLALGGLAWNSVAPDGMVIYRAASHFFSGEAVYDLARDFPTPFKYPPWVLGAMLPIAFLPPHVFVVFWQFLALSIILALSVKKWRGGTSSLALLLPGVAFWGIWNFNIRQGQVVIFTLGLSWFSLFLPRFLRSFVLAWALTVKLFTGVAVFFLPWRKAVRMILSGIPFLFFCLVPFILRGGFFSTLASWVSVGSELGPSTFGGAYSLTAWLSEVTALQRGNLTELVGLILMALACTTPWIWRARSGIKSFESQLESGLAFAPVIHPLTFSYSFAWVFPAAVSVFDFALKTGNRRLFGGAFIALLLSPWIPDVIFRSGDFRFGVLIYLTGHSGLLRLLFSKKPRDLEGAALPVLSSTNSNSSR